VKTAIVTIVIRGTDPPNSTIVLMSNAAGALAPHLIPPNLTLTILLKMNAGKIDTAVIGNVTEGIIIDHTATAIAPTRNLHPRKSYSLMMSRRRLKREHVWPRQS
jgi:hypothetical protein